MVDYRVGEKPARAVDGVDLEIARGRDLGLAGESGCGKSTIANAVMQILRPPARITGGSILFQGEDVTARATRSLRRYRWRNVSMVFQSAMNALNPVMRVERPVRRHDAARTSACRSASALARAGELARARRHRPAPTSARTRTSCPAGCGSA